MPLPRPRRVDLDVDGRLSPVWVHSPAASAPSRARPVLIVHGFRGDHHGMDLIAAAIGDRDVIVPDLPGFGENSGPDDELSLESYCAWIADLLAEVTRRWQVPPVLAGHSFGSILAAHTAALRPGVVPELILINPITTPALEGPAKFMTALTRLYYSLGARLPERWGRRLLSSPVIVRVMSEVMATTKDPGLRRYIHDQHSRYFSTFHDRRSLAQAFDVSVAHTVTEVAESLTMPVLVVAGDKDAIAPIPATRAFVAGLPDAEFVELDGVGHLVHYERPEAAASAIMGFCARRD